MPRTSYFAQISNFFKNKVFLAFTQIVTVYSEIRRYFTSTSNLFTLHRLKTVKSNYQIHS